MKRSIHVGRWILAVLLAAAAGQVLAQTSGGSSAGGGGGQAVASFLFNAVNSRLEAAASAASGRFVAFVMPLVFIGLTIYVMVIGMQVMQGRIASPIQELAWRLFRISLILSFLVGAGAYGDRVAGTIISMRDGLAAAADPGSNAGILATLNDISDIFDKKGAEHAQQVTLWGVIGAGFAHFVASILYWLCKVILIALALIPLLLATVHLYLAIAVGPLAIACLLFPVTTKYFDSWLGSVLVAIMTNVAVALILGFALSIFQGMASRIAAYDINTVNPVSYALDILVVLVVLGYCAWKASDLAAQWVGGGSPGNPAGMALSQVVSSGVTKGLSRLRGGNSIKPGSGGGG